MLAAHFSQQRHAEYPVAGAFGVPERATLAARRGENLFAQFAMLHIQVEIKGLHADGCFRPSISSIFTKQSSINNPHLPKQ